MLPPSGEMGMVDKSTCSDILKDLWRMGLSLLCFGGVEKRWLVTAVGRKRSEDGRGVADGLEAKCCCCGRDSNGRLADWKAPGTVPWIDVFRLCRRERAIDGGLAGGGGVLR